METQEHDALAQFARKHHVHYDVEPEEVVEGGRRELVGVQVRLFATLAEKAKLEAPEADSCTELLGELRSFAEDVVGSRDTESRLEFVPARPALYQSTVVPDADEVALTVRVHCGSSDHRAQGAGGDRFLSELRERLNSVGVQRR